MTPILLATLNARYHHTAFGLRYLYANLRELKAEARIVEFTIAQNPRAIAEQILALEPKLLALSVYIWNVKPTTELVSILKKIRPELKIVLGGPEVSHETAEQEITELSDLTVQGEGDLAFYELAHAFLREGKWPEVRAIQPSLPEIKQLALPYAYYSDEDIRNRVIYVEASRGCPYKCEYCLSSLDKSVRAFDLDRFLAEMGMLIDRGARQFKFVDRTFNLSITTSTRILEFFLSRIELGLFLHFEMVPDRLPVELRTLIERFPQGSIQFEIGIQTWSPVVSRLVSRRQDYAKIRENLLYLREIGTVHTHADLIAGLPGETLESFAHGFDQLAELAPDEIQVGILKRLRGTPIVRHDAEWEMIYQAEPPYTVLQTKTMDFATIQRITRFAHFWDHIANSGNFLKTTKLLRELSKKRTKPSFYDEFAELSEFLSTRHPSGHGVSLIHLTESLWLYLRSREGVSMEALKESLIADYTSGKKRDIPGFLRFDGSENRVSSKTRRASGPRNLPSRQNKHLLY